ncbi:MAG: hypothetical protein QM811_08450 [Pirellulales bacterium]
MSDELIAGNPAFSNGRFAILRGDRLVGYPASDETQLFLTFTPLAIPEPDCKLVVFICVTFYGLTYVLRTRF